MSTQQPDEHHHDPHGIDPIYREFPPDDSGTADSFDGRHNEFDPATGHHGAGHDRRTHRSVHGDGMADEEADEPRHAGFDAEQPKFVSERLQREAVEAHRKPGHEEHRLERLEKADRDGRHPDPAEEEH